ncbi:MAG: hypothetical protein LOY03_07120 [Cyclobacteriaceae bacterium]|nr:hypothetical protein [Cyclobacteriaceae bacterium]
MKPFLKELAERIVGDKIAPGELTVVFPNRRAILYFRKYLSELIDKPIFSPQLLTVEDFMASFTSLRVPDKLELVHHLHVVYKAVVKVEEPLDKFYFWGEMLLRDFDEINVACQLKVPGGRARGESSVTTEVSKGARHDVRLSHRRTERIPQRLLVGL